MPLGQKRLSIERWLEEQILPHFAGRILPVTQHIAETCADLLLTAKLAGTSPDPFDALIAATAKVHGLSVVTLNTKHFLAFNIPLTQI